MHAYVDPRRPLATELYVIGCEYVRLGAGVGITVRDGFSREQVMSDVRDALFRHLWPLPPGGATGTGWARGKSVRDRELEVVVAQVPGVDEIVGVSLFEAPITVPPAAGAVALGTFQPAFGAGVGSASALVATASGTSSFSVLGGPAPATASAAEARRVTWSRILPMAQGAAELRLRMWQLPELTAVIVDADGDVPADLRRAADLPGETGVAVPVVPEVC